MVVLRREGGFLTQIVIQYLLGPMGVLSPGLRKLYGGCSSPKIKSLHIRLLSENGKHI